MAEILPMPHCQPCGLADVMCEAPTLLAALPSQDWAALSRCGRQLQLLVHSCVTAVTVKEMGHASAVLKGSWPQLALIEVHSTTQHEMQLRWSQHSKFQLMASLEVLSISTAFAVSPKTQTDQRRSVAAAFSYLQSPRWRRVGCLSIVIHSLDKEIMARLTQSDCLHVSELSVMGWELLLCISWQTAAHGQAFRV